MELRLAGADRRAPAGGRLRGGLDLARATPRTYEELEEWLRVNALSAHLERLPPMLRDPYLEAVIDELGPDPSITYVRLNIDATAL